MERSSMAMRSLPMNFQRSVKEWGYDEAWGDGPWHPLDREPCDGAIATRIARK